MAGRVRVDGNRVDKAGFLIRPDSTIEIVGPHMPYVSRGGLKLEGALSDFGLAVEGFRCIDVGASTGGFTDCLLKHGASRVYAIDVGKNLLDASLRDDPRVFVIEECNARSIEPERLPETVELITIDVSFISLTLVVPPMLPFLEKRGYLLVLIKPQFELSRKEVGKGGVVREESGRMKAVNKVESFLTEIDLNVISWVPSRVKGPKGNQEYFMLSSR